MSSTVDTLLTYEPGKKSIFFRDETEQKCLAAMHTYITPTVYDGRLIYDNNVKLAEDSQVLDAGAGSGCWLLDLAKQVPGSVKIYGVDIYSANFPQSHPPNVQFKVESVTSLPVGWTGTFDFVNERLLGIGLLRSEWPTALSELFRVLKPGGSIQLLEHISEAENAGPAWTRILGLVEELFSKRGLIPDCPLQLPGMLKAAGFVDVVAEKRHYPIGQAGGELGKLASETIIDGCHNLMNKITEDGTMGNAKSELDALMWEAKKDWDGPECMMGTAWIICAKKPL